MDLSVFAQFADVPLRLALAAVFVGHGYRKLFAAGGFSAHVRLVKGLGFPLPKCFAFVSAVTEFAGGLLVFAGAFTRVAAVLIAVNMLVALYAQKVVWKKQFLMGYEFDVVLVAAAVSLAFLGAGFFSLDVFLGLPLR